jgi:hypothetical protein
LEIAYGPIVGTNPTITEDDFEVDTTDGMHKPQPTPEETRDPPDEGSPFEEEADQWRGSGERGSHQTTPVYTIGDDEDESQNVWK